MDELDFIQIKISCASKLIVFINIVKGNPLKGSKYLQIKIQIFKELLQLNDEKTNNLKTDQGLELDISPKIDK